MRILGQTERQPNASAMCAPRARDAVARRFNF